MASEIDHDAIKEQVVAILKTDSDLYSVTGADSKVRTIIVEHPDNPSGLDKVLPSIYITNANPFERITKIGVKTRSTEATTPLVHEFRYNIVLAVDSKDARTSIERLDDFQKLILQTMEEDSRLKKGGAALVDDSTTESVRNFSELLNGKSIQGRVIPLLCRKVTF